MGELYQKLTEYGKSDYYPYHMPGHKRRLTTETLGELAGIDITEIDGFDNLHEATGILQKIQKKAACVYGAQESYYLINGSTAGVLAAISATVSEGGKILMVRGAHKSAYHAAFLKNLQITYLWPGVHPVFGNHLPADADEIREALDREQDIQAVFIVSPTYEGLVADVKKIAEIVHARGIPLIVDEAHGAHLGFAEGFALNSSRLGADLVVSSLHKTLPAPTQTAVLHVCGSLADRKKLRRYLSVYQSSSPSYLFMAAMEDAIDLVSREKEKLFGQFRAYWKEMMQQLQNCKNLIFLQEKNSDIGKLVIADGSGCFSGAKLYEILLTEYHLQMEMAAGRYVLAMFTVGDDIEGYRRLTKALLEIDERCISQGAPKMPCRQLQARAVMSIGDAWDAEKATLPLQKTEGCISAEYINLYPPGSPILVPGEVITKEIINEIEDYLKNGFHVQGICREQNGIGVSIVSGKRFPDTK